MQTSAAPAWAGRGLATTARQRRLSRAAAAATSQADGRVPEGLEVHRRYDTRQWRCGVEAAAQLGSSRMEWPWAGRGGGGGLQGRRRPAWRVAGAPGKAADMVSGSNDAREGRELTSAWLAVDWQQRHGGARGGSGWWHLTTKVRGRVDAAQEEGFGSFPLPGFQTWWRRWRK